MLMEKWVDISFVCLLKYHFNQFYRGFGTGFSARAEIGWLSSY